MIIHVQDMQRYKEGICCTKKSTDAPDPSAQLGPQGLVEYSLLLNCLESKEVAMWNCTVNQRQDCSFNQSNELQVIAIQYV